MKLLDDVIVISDDYKEEGIIQGMVGTIIEADIRWESFYVCFQDQRVYDKEFMKNKDNVFKLKDDICIGVKIKDLKILKDNKCSDEIILNSLPKNHKNHWCKVEDGFIVNLAGEKKNKTAYKFDS